MHGQSGSDGSIHLIEVKAIVALSLADLYGKERLALFLDYRGEAIWLVSGVQDESLSQIRFIQKSAKCHCSSSHAPLSKPVRKLTSNRQNKMLDSFNAYSGSI